MHAVGRRENLLGDNIRVIRVSRVASGEKGDYLRKILWCCNFTCRDIDARFAADILCVKIMLKMAYHLRGWRRLFAVAKTIGSSLRGVLA